MTKTWETRPAVAQRVAGADSKPQNKLSPEWQRRGTDPVGYGAGWRNEGGGKDTVRSHAHSRHTQMPRELDPRCLDPSVKVRRRYFLCVFEAGRGHTLVHTCIRERLLITSVNVLSSRNKYSL